MSSFKTIKFTDYDAIGFDMDYTLARYELVPFFNMVYDGVCKFLVEKKDYNASLFHHLHEDKDLIYKGLVADFDTGNILKLDHKGSIQRATHGTKKLSQAEIEAVYGPGKKFSQFDTLRNGMKSTDGSWRFFDNYFDLPGLVAFARIVDSIRREGTERSTYIHIWADVMSALEDMYAPNQFAAHQGNFFCHMKDDTSKYIDRVSQQIKQWLENLRKDNRKVFLLTSSHADFASHVMNFAFGPDWRRYFDLVIYGGRKPKFFTEQRPFVEVVDLKLGNDVKILKAGGEYCFGNLTDLMTFLKEATGKPDPKVLYVGDNLWADAWPSKTQARWDTVLVLEEMDAEGYAESDGTVPQKKVESPKNPSTSKGQKYKHSSLVTDEEIELMVSDFWGSVFIDQPIKNGTKAGDAAPMDTAYGYFISQFADICVPSIEYLAGVPVDNVFNTFGPDPGNVRGFHPGCPCSLCSS